jgi:hypothetical protein
VHAFWKVTCAGTKVVAAPGVFPLRVKDQASTPMNAAGTAITKSRASSPKNIINIPPNIMVKISFQPSLSI